MSQIWETTFSWYYKSSHCSPQASNWCSSRKIRWWPAGGPMSNFVEASAVGLMAGPAAPIKHKGHYPNKELKLIVTTIMSHIEITHTSIHCSLIFITVMTTSPFSHFRRMSQNCTTWRTLTIELVLLEQGSTAPWVVSQSSLFHAYSRKFSTHISSSLKSPWRECFWA